MKDEIGGIGEMVMLSEADYDELLGDIEYWSMTAMMLSALLTENSIEHEVSEESLEEYIIENTGLLQ